MADASPPTAGRAIFKLEKIAACCQVKTVTCSVAAPSQGNGYSGGEKNSMKGCGGSSSSISITLTMAKSGMAGADLQDRSLSGATPTNKINQDMFIYVRHCKSLASAFWVVARNPHHHCHGL